MQKPFQYSISLFHRFFRQLYTFFLYFLLSTFCFVTRPGLNEKSNDINTFANCSNITGDLVDSEENYVFSPTALLGDPDYVLPPNRSYDPATDLFQGSGAEEVEHDLLESPEILHPSMDEKLPTAETNHSAEDQDQDMCLDQEEPDTCYLHTYDTTMKKLRGLAEVILVFWSLFYLVTAAK